MDLLEKVSEIWAGDDSAFLVHSTGSLSFVDIRGQRPVDLSAVRSGDVVALIGDFDPQSIHTLLRLFSLSAIVLPLTSSTRSQHEYFFESALVDVVIEGSHVYFREETRTHELLDFLKNEAAPGLILFSTGTTGRPKAILHDFRKFLSKFSTPRPTLRTLNFLLFDHIGGINTLLHTLFNKGVVIAPETRTVDSILEISKLFGAEVLPATPTFLRLLLMSGKIPEAFPGSIKLVTYGTELMDESTLQELCRLLPDVDFRQTFGMSELGIVRVKSEARDSLFMKIGGEGVETRVVDNVLQIKSASRMLGYLNAASPFDDEGWYDSKDVVDVKGEYIRVTGRVTDVINVGGLKFMASEVEREVLKYKNISLVKATGRNNPVTGQHVEIVVQPKEGLTIDPSDLLVFLREHLPPHMIPAKIRIEEVSIGHRFKKR
jgi:acyl-CoA synthetase (AMP-forming)/AMP-acid ligase II